jgi:hypothetical protein
MKKSPVAGVGVIRKHYGGQKQHRTTHQQINLSGFIEFRKCTLKFDAVTTSD